MDECCEAFQEDRDVHPARVLDTGSESEPTMREKRKRKTGMTEYQARRLELKEQEFLDKRQYRADVAASLKKIAEKL